MEQMQLDISRIYDFISAEEIKMLSVRARAAQSTPYALCRSGKKTELLVNYHNKLHYVPEWWKPGKEYVCAA